MGIKGHFFLEWTILQSTHLLILVTLALLVMRNLQSKDTQSKGLKLMNKWQGVWNFPSYYPNKIIIIPLQQNHKLKNHFIILVSLSMQVINIWFVLCIRLQCRINDIIKNVLTSACMFSWSLVNIIFEVVAMHFTVMLQQSWLLKHLATAWGMNMLWLLCQL